ncbi:hypothetical protein M3Y99_00263000 [Aphelenchoides fujianensis]|nr:hypothetical protein M3Y99_00263000 [Aphelenchoides fujianensis]
MLLRLFVVLLLLLLLFTLCSARTEEKDPLKKFDRVRVDEKNFDKVRNLHINWYVHSIKALMGQLGKELYAKLDRDEQTLLLRCLDRIEDRRDLVESARCLVLARKRFRLGGGARKPPVVATPPTPPAANSSESRADLRTANGAPAPTVLPRPYSPGANRTATRFVYDRRHHRWNSTSSLPAVRPNAPRSRFIPTVAPPVYRTNQQANGRRGEMERKSEAKAENPLGKLLNIKKITTAKIAMLKSNESNGTQRKALKSMSTHLFYQRFRKRTKRSRSWFGDQSRVKDERPSERTADGKEGWKVKKADRFSLLTSADKSPVSRIANLISTFARAPDQNETETRTAKERVNRWSHTYKKLLDMKKTMEERENSPGARVYSHRMYDLVLDSERPSMSPKQSKRPEGLVQMAMDLFSRVSGDKARGERQKSNTKILSPRFAPLMPDKVETEVAQLSPTILSFYEEPNNTANIASIPTILKATGMDKKDSDAVMATIMDVSGARDTVEDALHTLNDLNFFGIEGEIMSVTENMAKIYDQLEGSMKKQQNRDLDKKGFTFLDKGQLNKIYRDSALKVPEEALDFDDYAELDVEHREEALWKTIEKIAINKPDEPRAKGNGTAGHRGKRDLVTPSILQPVVLAPFMFAPVFGLVVLGPTVLSPNIFSPLILNPSVLSPYVLSPAVGIPFILSPYLLSPYVLSPLVFAPFILNPYVLCPDVLSPMTLGGAILSPSVASPAVFTETFLMANILSPSFLS